MIASPRRSSTVPPLIVMGMAGSGKTTPGAAPATRLLVDACLDYLADQGFPALHR